MEFESAGFKLIPGFLTPGEIEDLLAALRSHRPDARRGGIRHIDRLVPSVAALAQKPKILAAAASRLNGIPRLVRAIYFDKSPANNWLVTWHQDRTVAVSERFEANGWGPWSRKDDVWHVQPPLHVLQSMITVRLHLDAASKDNGCLKVIPGSHQAGLIESGKVLEYVDNDAARYLEVLAGDALLMRPHLLHASEKSTFPAPRRILHFEYSSHALPDGIAWSA